MTKPVKTGRGAVKNNLTPQRKEIIERAARAGCSLKQIACLLGIGDRTLDKWIKREDVEQVYQAARMTAILNVADMLYNLAMAGDLNAVIFYLRCQGGWKVASDQVAQIDNDDQVLIYLPENGRDRIE
jgi:transcriptional regulator with XRE-family HTH domain